MKDSKKLLLNTGIIFAGTIIGSFCSYLYNMLMGRMLGPEQYGQMTALLSMMLIVTIGGGAIGNVVTRYASDFYHRACFGALNKLFGKLTKYMFVLSACLLFIGIFFISFIGKFFSISNPVPIVIALVSMIFGYTVVVNRGILQGAQKFREVSISNVAEALLRLVAGYILVRIGFGIDGALIAIVFSGASIYLLTLYQARRVLSVSESKDKEDLVFSRKEIFNYSIPSFLNALFLAVIMNIDIIMINHFFPGPEAGLYSAVSTVGKIILFITAPISSVLFPMISERKTTGEKHYRLFFMGLAGTVVIGLLILGIYVMMPGKILLILYGRQYSEFFYLLPEVGLAFLFCSLVNLLANYYLAIKNYVFLWFFGLITLASLLVIYFYHPSILFIVRILITSFGLLFFLMMVYYLYTKKEQIIFFLKGEYGQDTETFNNNPGV